MIEHVQIRNFKSLRRVDLRLGKLNLFVGANSSGKSNFLDALRVVQGIGNGFTISEILDGKPRTATAEVWDGIRGGAEFAAFRSSEETENAGVVSFDITGRVRRLPEAAGYPFNFESASRQNPAESCRSASSQIVGRSSLVQISRIR
jgi:hypothetical protein